MSTATKVIPAQLASATHPNTRAFAFGGIDRAEVVETGPSTVARCMTWASRMTIRPLLAVGSHLPHLPWPFGVVESACAALMPAPGAVRATVALPNADAQLIRDKQVPPSDGAGRVILYLHGGAFVACGVNSHSGMVTAISRFADAPVLFVNYRLVPRHSIEMALDDCYDGYCWLREQGYQPEQIAFAGDSAGGYLALALTQRLQREGEVPAALVAMSPLLQLDKHHKQAHPNSKTDAMFPTKAWDALVALITRANAKHGEPDELYEPLDHIAPGLPPMQIHVSESEVLLHDARLAADKLAAAGVFVELRIWPGQTHMFQVAAPIVPEATRSLRQVGEFLREATIGVSTATRRACRVGV